MSQRDYARVLWWKGKTLGVMLVNRNRQNFFLHAVTLRNMLDDDDELKMVKRLEREPDKIATRHPGDIIGKATRSDSEVVIKLVFGPACSRIDISSITREAVNAIDQQSFAIPKNEFDAHWASVKIMLEQEKPCDDQWEESRGTIPAFYYDLPFNSENEA